MVHNIKGLALPSSVSFQTKTSLHAVARLSHSVPLKVGPERERRPEGPATWVRTLPAWDFLSLYWHRCWILLRQVMCTYEYTTTHQWNEWYKALTSVRVRSEGKAAEASLRDAWEDQSSSSTTSFRSPGLYLQQPTQSQDPQREPVPPWLYRQNRLAYFLEFRHSLLWEGYTSLLSPFILKSPDYLENIFPFLLTYPHMQHTDKQTLPSRGHLTPSQQSTTTKPLQSVRLLPMTTSGSFISISNLRIWESKGTLESTDSKSLASPSCLLQRWD